MSERAFFKQHLGRILWSYPVIDGITKGNSEKVSILVTHASCFNRGEDAKCDFDLSKPFDFIARSYFFSFCCTGSKPDLQIAIQRDYFPAIFAFVYLEMYKDTSVLNDQIVEYLIQNDWFESKSKVGRKFKQLATEYGLSKCSGNYWYQRFCNIMRGFEIDTRFRRLKCNVLIQNPNYHFGAFAYEMRKCLVTFGTLSSSVDGYLHANKAAKEAVDTWLVVGRHLGVSKDMRRMIGMLIWNSREVWFKECLPNKIATWNVYSNKSHRRILN